MGIGTFPIVAGAAISGNDTTAKAEPGTIMAVRTAKEWSLVEYVELDNNGVSQGEALVSNLATIGQGRVAKAATSDEGAPIRGIAAATIASQRFGWMYIGGYVEKADFSQTTASGEYLMISGSTAGKISNNRASAAFVGTQGNASMFVVIGQARAAIGTGVGSMVLLGVWG